MGKINTVLFDFDGTIMDTNDLIIKSWQHTFKIVEGKERDESEIISTFGEPLSVTMEKLLPQIPTEEGLQIYRSFHRDKFSELISLFPGVCSLLKRLKDKDYRMGVVTSRLKITTYEGLEKYNLTPYFNAIITCDECSKHKPDPEPVNVALAKLGSKPEEAIMLGDSMFDILCARNAGVKSVLVGWALAVTEKDKTGKDAPDFIIENAKDLLHILEKQN